MTTDKRKVSLQIASRWGSLSNSSYVRSFPSFLASRISRRSLFCTSWCRARTQNTRAKADEVVSIAAKVKVLRQRLSNFWNNETEQHSRHLSDQFLFWQPILLIGLHISAYWENIFIDKSKIQTNSNVKAHIRYSWYLFPAQSAFPMRHHLQPRLSSWIRKFPQMYCALCPLPRRSLGQLSMG